MTNKILITGAAGKTGESICRAVSGCGIGVRAWVKRESQMESARQAGAVEVLVGDLQDRHLAETACRGATAIYHIPPNMHPAELEIATGLIQAAQNAGMRRFVYHSVLHPQVEAMPHHWLKMRVEEGLFTSGLAFTILQPAAYMQNLQGYLPTIVNEGKYALPYSVDAPISQVDLEDVALVAVKVLTHDGHDYATYELCGSDILSARQIAGLVSARLNREVQAIALDRVEWERSMRAADMPDYAIRTLVKMFLYYENHGFYGNSLVLEWLLGRPPTRFDQFLDRILPASLRGV
ncbi:MAG: NmrA family NAD(P)-binding protein [Bellilinea sp.]|jgi:uncharacterized protein YbjT (DUF2867 family)